MSFMQLQITQPGRLASIECAKCGSTNYWHEWASDGQAEDLKSALCAECCTGKMNPETFWESPSRNYYAGRYSAPGYLDCTEYSYGKNKRKLEKELREMFGD